MPKTDQNHQPITRNLIVFIALAVLFVLSCSFCVFSIWLVKFSLQKWGTLWSAITLGILFFVGAFTYRKIGFTLKPRESLQVFSMMFSYFYVLMSKEEHKLVRLNKAIHKLSKFLNHENFLQNSDDYKRLLFDWLSRLYFERYQINLELEDLNHAVNLMRNAIQFPPDTLENRANQLSLLGQVNWHEYKRSMEISSLDIAIDNFMQAADLVNIQSAKAKHLRNAALAYHERYDSNNQPEDLDRALELSKLAMEIATTDSKALSSYQYQYAIALVALYARVGDLVYFSEAQDLLILLLEDLSISPLTRANVLLALGRAFDARFDLTGNQEYLNQAIAHLRQATDMEVGLSSDQAVFNLTFGASLLKLGRYTSDINVLEEGISINEKAAQLAFEGSDIYAMSLTNIGEGCRLLYDQTNSISYLEKGEYVLRRAFSTSKIEHALFSMAHLNLGAILQGLYSRLGKSDRLYEARQNLELAIQKGLPNNDLQAAGYSNLATVLHDLYYRTGDIKYFQESIQNIQQAVDICPQESANRYVFLNNYASFLRFGYQITGNLSDLRQAVFLLNEGLKAENISNWNKALLFANISLAYNNQYQHSNDLEDINHAIDSILSALNYCAENAPEKAKYMSFAGTLLMQRSALTKNQLDYEKATIMLANAIDLIDPGESYYLEVLGHIGHAWYWLAWSKDVAKEEDELLGKALNMFQLAEQYASESNVQAPEIYKFFGSLLSRKYWLMNDPKDLDDAKLYLQRACREGLMSQDILEAAARWARLTSNEGDWQSTVEALTYEWKALNDLYQTQFVRSSKVTWLEHSPNLSADLAYAHAKCGNYQKAVEILEQGRVRLLTESQELTRKDLERLGETGHSDLLDKYKQTLQRLLILEKIAPTHEMISPQANYYSDLQSVKRELNECVQRIRSIPNFSEFLTTLDFEKIQNTFDSGEAGIYLCISKFGGVAFMVNPAGVFPIWLEVTSADVKSWLTPQEAVEQVTYISSQEQPLFFVNVLDRMLSQIGEKFIKPIILALRQADVSIQSIVLIPTGQLNILPIHAATFTDDVERYNLMELYSVRYTPSVKTLLHSKRLLEGLRETEPEFFALGQLLPATRNNLKYVDLEIEIASSYFSKQTVFHACQATLLQVCEQLQNAAYVHFACHGEFNAADPLASGLILDSTQRLTLKELIGLNHRNLGRLAVLSACQTGLSEYERVPEESIGLSGGLLEIGFAGVIGTLWSVNDLSIALLMLKFYKYHLQDQLQPADALQKAQLWLRDATNHEISILINEYRQSEKLFDLTKSLFRKFTFEDPKEKPFASPYFWAPFVLYGK
jgi:CHAT domain-containing protein